MQSAKRNCEYVDLKTQKHRERIKRETEDETKTYIKEENESRKIKDRRKSESA
jgi:hypothetical protein